ncbi:MAG: lantibiotic dehydratase family protein, partial [Candidatus Krumholzibacteriia bacterium]
MWFDSPDSDRGTGVERALVKYFVRMAGRCTPFGLFAGGSVGSLGEQTRLELQERGCYRRHTRLDMDFLSALVDGLNRDPDLRRELRFRPNSSLYRLGDRVRYAEARLQGRVRSYFLVVADADEFLRSTLERAAGGARRAELARGLVDDQITLQEAEAYVDELIDSQILVPDLAPAVTGRESIDDVLVQLRDKKSTREVTRTLDSVREGLAQLDRDGLGAGASRYREIAASLKDLPADTDIAKLFQVDMTKPAARMQLGMDVVHLMMQGVEILHRLFGAGPKDALEGFRSAFKERYGDRELPLVEVLDEEIGIGFGASKAPGADASPLLAGPAFPARPDERTRPVNARTAFLRWKLAETLAAGKPEMVLTDEELALFETSNLLPLPDAFHVTAAVLPADTTHPGPRLLVSGAGGPSGARLLGRFCHADAELREMVLGHLRQEEALRADCTHFEIVHLPEGRIGNILARPLFREYELAFLGRSGAAPDRQLDIRDLTICLDG